MGSSSLGFNKSSITAVRSLPRVPPHALPGRACAVPDVVVSVPRTRLRRWNAAMSLFHLVLFLTTLAVGNIDLRGDLYRTRRDFRERIRFVDNGTRNETVGWDLFPYYEQSGSLPITVLVALFFLLSSTFHALNATLLWQIYVHELERCRTPTRWIEYALSAPVMIVVIGYTLGIRNAMVLLAVATLVFITMPFGYWVEVVARPASLDAWTLPLSARLAPWVVGHVPQLIAWLIILLPFYDNGPDRPPWWVSFILWGELLLFFSFGAASLWSQIHPPRRFYEGELYFQVLSLVSKGLLGILLISNVLMLSRFEDIYDVSV